MLKNMFAVSFKFFKFKSANVPTIPSCHVTSLNFNISIGLVHLHDILLNIWINICSTYERVAINAWYKLCRDCIVDKLRAPNVQLVYMVAQNQSPLKINFQYFP